MEESLKEDALNLCRNIASSQDSGIVAACFYGPRVCGYADEGSGLDVLLVLSNYSSMLRGYHKPVNGIHVFVLAVDQAIFERDVEQGWLGEFVAEKIMVPYEAFVNDEYLLQNEMRLKKRIVWELLENIILEFPELSHEILIKPEYFMYEEMMRRARLFPPIAYSFLNMLRTDLKGRNVESMMKGYLSALEELVKEKHIAFSNGNVKVTGKFISLARAHRFRLPVFFRSLQRAALHHIISLLPKMMEPLARDEEIFIKSHRDFEPEEITLQLEDPEKYLLVLSPVGPVALSDKTTIEGFVEKIVPREEFLGMGIEETGGVLNAVYTLTLRKHHEQQKVAVKKFRNWLGFKWFPLALWALGTKSFAVLGRSRLEREYAINQFLHRHGFPVPRVLYLSPREGLIFRGFVEGENLVRVIKRIISSREDAAGEINLIKEAGKKIAEAHGLGVALGDCKPENIIVAEGRKLYFVDLEQAARNGNQAWDVAEFLYYSGHYVSPISSTDAVEIIAKNFIEGYLEAGGRKETIRRAASPRYTKVFAIFTPPHAILAISNLCKKMGR